MGADVNVIYHLTGKRQLKTADLSGANRGIADLCRHSWMVD